MFNVGGLVMEFETGIDVHLAPIALQVGDLAGVGLAQGGFRTVFHYSFRVKVGVSRVTCWEAGFLVVVPRRNVFLFVGSTRVVDVMLGREAISVYDRRDVPVCVAPVTVVQGASVLRRTFEHATFFHESDRYRQAINYHGSAAITVDLFRVVIVLFRVNLLANGRFYVVFRQNRVNQAWVCHVLRCYAH